MMNTYYFTYGLEGYPFVGGWTMIEGKDAETAIKLFRVFHPDRNDGILNCASVYSHQDFVKTSMFKNGSFGERCHEIIRVERILFNE